MRLAVSAVIALNRGFDEAGLAGSGQRVAEMARMRRQGGLRRRYESQRLVVARQRSLFRNRLANHRADGIFVHRSSAVVVSPSQRVITRQVNMVNDANHGGIDGRRFSSERISGRLALDDDEDALADTGAHGINRQERNAPRFAFECQRLHQQQLCTLELPILLGRHHRADDPRNLHVRYSRSQRSTMPTIDASVGGSAG
jgi:hypothetical protein